MNSCIYKGQVNHRRFKPRAHEFTYSLFMMYVDLEELPNLFSNNRYWQVEKAGLASFYRKDHYGDAGQDLSTMIHDIVYKHTGDVVNGPIRLLTHFRYLGHVFNPISVYYCYDHTDTHLTHVVAEVTNTPWKEQHCYVLSGEIQQDRFIAHAQRKEFHVSPFMNMDMNYQWNIQIPSEQLKLKIENISDNDKLFDASMSLKRIELNNKNLISTLVNYPFMTLKVVSAIHIQALKLWLKGIDYVPHPKNN